MKIAYFISFVSYYMGILQVRNWPLLCREVLNSCSAAFLSAYPAVPTYHVVDIITRTPKFFDYL